MFWDIRLSSLVDADWYFWPSIVLHNVMIGVAGVKRWEEERDQVNVYFEELSTKRQCVGFLVVQETQVENPLPAIIRIYDYYQQELSVSTVSSCCLSVLTLKTPGKVKWSRYRPGVSQRVGRGITLLFHDHGTRRVWVVSSTPWPHFTTGEDPVPILQEAGWAPGRSGREENLVFTWIRSWTFQPVASIYTIYIYIYI